MLNHNNRGSLLQRLKNIYLIQQDNFICLTSLVNFMVCRASSLVGVRMRALAPVWAWRALSFSNMGTRKAAVLPLPVRAMATISLPSKITGMVWSGDEKNQVWELSCLEVQTFDSRQVKWAYFSLDGSRNLVTFLHDSFVYRVTKTWNHTKWEKWQTSLMKTF